MFWDVFCRVIDNHGDLGVCWRLSADLAARGERVRLWIDDPSALAWMAPRGCNRVEVLHWHEPVADVEPGDVVVEAFGCNPPDGFVARMQRAQPPVWINLEYLSAEDYVERSHGLMSPVMSGPGAGLRKWFFYPGFTARTGGLLCEPGLLDRQRAHNRQAWLTHHATAALEGERVISLFCYRQAPVTELLSLLQHRPTLLLVTPGIATELVNAALPEQLGAGQGTSIKALRIHALPHLAQPQFDELLWSCDLNFVRGEDSFVRAQWAGVPMVWNIYPQNDGVHADKLDAFLQRYLCAADPAPAESLTHCWHWWNGLSQKLPASLPQTLWAHTARSWVDHISAQADLTTGLMAFAKNQRIG